MGKTTDDETAREIARFDKEGNFKCVRCGWTHTTTECAELRLVHANRELEKAMKFVHTHIGQGQEGESPIDTLIRGYKRVYASWETSQRAKGESTEVTEMLKEKD